MSAPELPDDPRDWPTDPFALLGISPGSDELAVKRAYTRLIRRFKPEHAPEQFRRIREAYEACLDRFRWYMPAPEFDPPDEPVVRVSAPPAEAAPEPDAVDRLWAAAVAGREAEAYAGLVGQAAARPERTDIPLRLYWLLALDPALDSGRTRHHWLVGALAAARLAGPAAELYRRELEADPNVALYDPYRDLLATPAATRDVLTLAHWRLAAAGRSRSWHPAETDLNTLSRRLPFEDEAGWLGYVTAALDRATWETAYPLYDRAKEELGRLRHLELSHAYWFDRVEETEHLAADWRRRIQKGGVPELLALVPHAWVGDLPPASVGPAVAATLKVTADYALRQCDQLPGLYRQLLARGLDNHWRAHGGGGEAEFPPEWIRGLARELPCGWKRPYDDLRADLLEFLLAEAIHPVEFADACRDHPDSPIRVKAGAVWQDASLRLVWLACRLHRG